MGVLLRGIVNVYRMVVVLFATAIFSIISIMGMISTCYITSEAYEVTFFCKDNVVINVVFLIVCVSILLALNERGIFNIIEEKLNDDKIFKKAKLFFLSIILCLGITM
ncbi:hypothetical protein SAMN04487830_14211 [Pseudobutyrivibrio sp. OR37]|uniref:hypothetical protein n=1 Tax=Pseudobutyrivibrio sp. OR37 TaxID=1798186 RepID=UPI0008EBB586|nr:hypothetical protein [Pseudobutyrivibrio sp. OR37]SFI32241.1 hypothetical protein SAMN04487830_14211 [Pseudobutyrivibrio sp. OR37]